MGYFSSNSFDESFPMDITSEFAPLILANLNTPWERVLALGTPLSFPPKKLIPTHSGNSSLDGMYYITHGRVRLSHIAPNGSEKVLFHMGKGMLFNEIPMFLSLQNSLFTAVEPTKAYFWPRHLLTLSFTKEYPDLINNLLQSLSRKASNFHIQLCAQGLFTSFVNVCRALYSMHLFQRNHDIVTPHLTQHELAAILGVHRSSLHKALTRLKDENVIASYSKKELVITNLEALLHYALGDDPTSD